MYKARDARLQFDSFAINSNTSYVQGYDEVEVGFSIAHFVVGDGQPAWGNITVKVSCLTPDAVTNSSMLAPLSGLFVASHGCSVLLTNGSDVLQITLHSCRKPFEVGDHIRGSVGFRVLPSN